MADDTESTSNVHNQVLSAHLNLLEQLSIEARAVHKHVAILPLDEVGGCAKAVSRVKSTMVDVRAALNLQRKAADCPGEFSRLLVTTMN